MLFKLQWYNKFSIHENGMKNPTGKYYFNKTDGKYRTVIIFEHTFQKERCGFCLKNYIFLKKI